MFEHCLYIDSMETAFSEWNITAEALHSKANVFSLQYVKAHENTTSGVFQAWCLESVATLLTTLSMLTVVYNQKWKWYVEFVGDVIFHLSIFLCLIQGWVRMTWSLGIWFFKWKITGTMTLMMGFVNCEQWNGLTPHLNNFTEMMSALVKRMGGQLSHSHPGARWADGSMSGWTRTWVKECVCVYSHGRADGFCSHWFHCR